MTVLFWTLFLLIVYCYFGYPLLIWLFARLAPRRVRRAEILPSVSVVISAHNEADVIGRKLQNLLALDYPADSLEIFIGCDGCTDGTVEIIKRFSSPRIKVFEYPRRGKMSVLNDLVAQSKSEIILFNDARQVLEVDAVRKLMRNFADPDVGCASGELVFSERQGMTARGINLYWEYEKFMRDCESDVHSMLGATGAIYAIRRRLFSPGPANVVLDDMYTPLKIITLNYRAVFDGSAHAFDKAADDPKEEHRRKARTLYGNYQIFFLFPELFNPFTSPVAIQFFSHKLLRVIVPFLMIGLVPVNIALLYDPAYKLLMVGQVLFYGAALTGTLARDSKYVILKVISRFCYVPYVFCLLNFSALSGFWRFIKAKQDTAWQKARQ